MNTKHWIMAAAATLFASTAFSQQQTWANSEWVTPDSGFKSSHTRADLRNDLRNSDRASWQHRDGQDPVYSTGNRSRNELRSEIAMSARNGEATRMNKLYFGD